MKSSTIWIIVVVVFLAVGVVAYVVRAPENHTNSNSENPAPIPDSSGSAVLKITGAEHTIHMQSNKFVPQDLTIRAGDKVTFVNDDSEQHWPASDPHPVHTLCPGFDAGQGLGKGDTYSFTFEKVETCAMHDHLMPLMRGKIIIQ